MYWSKVATTEQEFDAIAALNYETFVEEIPQHEQNSNKRLVDKFHAENTYIVVHSDSSYLKARQSAQISTIQPTFERDFKKLMELFSNIMKTL